MSRSSFHFSSSYGALRMLFIVIATANPHATPFPSFGTNRVSLNKLNRSKCVYVRLWRVNHNNASDLHAHDVPVCPRFNRNCSAEAKVSWHRPLRGYGERRWCIRNASSIVEMNHLDSFSTIAASLSLSCAANETTWVAWIVMNVKYTSDEKS